MRAIDVLFWVLLLAGIGIILWLLFGSPDVISALISVVLFVATSEMLLWKKLFEVEKELKIEIESLKATTLSKRKQK